MKHTPGPWDYEIEDYGDGDETYLQGTIWGPAGHGKFRPNEPPDSKLALADVDIDGLFPLDYEEVSANIRLMAAAPDLLTACKAAAEWLRLHMTGDVVLDQLTAAIRRAEGDSPDDDAEA